MSARRIGIAVLVLMLGVAAVAGYWLYDYGRAAGDPAYFEDAIVAFEAADAAAPPAPGQIVFVGSSSIRFWNTLAEDMAPLSVINRGFGGSHFSHLVHNAGRIITPYRPRAVVVYAGDNDLAEGTGKTPETVRADLHALVDRIRAELPEVQIYLLSIKPSPLRWSRWPAMAQANALIAGDAALDPRLIYVDVAGPLLGADGEPDSDLFLIDGLHLNAAGYAAWTRVVEPLLQAAQPEPGPPAR